MSLIPAFGRQRQVDLCSTWAFQAAQEYIVRKEKGWKKKTVVKHKQHQVTACDMRGNSIQGDLRGKFHYYLIKARRGTSRVERAGMIEEKRPA